MTQSDHGLGRRSAPDDNDQKFRMQALVKATPIVGYRYHTPTAVLDQGGTSSCVGHAWRAWMSGSPIRTKRGPDPYEVYQEAREVDEWPGEDYDGTSVRAGAKVLEARGHVEQYLWAWDTDTVLRFIMQKGPVVIGTTWYESMFQTDDKGYLHVGGRMVGGHAYIAYGYNSQKGLRLQNSWGVGWGQKGRFWLREEDFDRLLNEDGEACTAIERAVI